MDWQLIVVLLIIGLAALRIVAGVVRAICGHRGSGCCGGCSGCDLSCTSCASERERQKRGRGKKQPRP